MAIEDVIETLHGFASAYERVASQVDPEDSHQLRITGLRNESFGLLIAAITQASGGNPQNAVDLAVHVGKYVVSTLFAVIKLKQHLKGQPATISITGDNNNVTVINGESVAVVAPRVATELLQQKTIDAYLNKMVEPLHSGTVDELLMKTEDSAEPLEMSIRSTEREYFRPAAPLTTSEDTEIVGTLVSLNKERNRGSFKLGNDQRIPYHYIGDNREQFHAGFAHKGTVKARVVAEFDANLQPIRLEIKEVEPIQLVLDLRGETDAS